MSIKKKRCFVVGPIGDPDSEMRIHADWLLEEIVLPVMNEFPEFEVVRADNISQPGMIDAQIIQSLLDADLVIADLSRGNANAFYEIGIRHMAQKPIIHMHLAEEKIPFDASLYRATKFSRLRPLDLRKARDELKRAVQAILADDYKVDNPITRTRGQIRLEATATPEQMVMLETLRSMQERLELLESQSGSRRGFDSGQRNMPTHSEISMYVHYQSSVKNPADLHFRVNRILERIGAVGRLDRGRGYIEIALPERFTLTDEWKMTQDQIAKVRGVESVSEIPF